MRLPFEPPLEPMLARPATAIPTGEGWLYEPKWDGFRALVFRDGEEVYVQSRDLKPLARYFPELPPALQDALPERCVLDGEIVIAGTTGLDFDALLLRIHPAASRVALLAAASPASYVAWDLLAFGGEDLRRVPFGERRARLEAAMQLPAAVRAPSVHVTPVTRDATVAADWFDRFEGAGLDGVVAKRLDGVYEPGRRAMVKVKHVRTADCAVAGFRWHKNGPGTLVGSLVLGLFDEAGVLQNVGVTSSFTLVERAALVTELAAAPRSVRSKATPGRSGPSGRLGPQSPAGVSPGWQAAGTAAATSPGSRFGSSVSARSPTTTCRETASVTPRPSGAGGSIAPLEIAVTTSWKRHPRSSSPASSADGGPGRPSRAPAAC